MDTETKIAILENALERAYETEMIDGSVNEELIAELSTELESLYQAIKKLEYNNNMKNIVVIKIHNNSVSSVYQVDTVENAKGLVKDLFFAQFHRPLNDEEMDDLEDRLEIYNDEDHDNHFTFSVAFVDG